MKANQGGTIIYCLYTFPLHGIVPSDPCIIKLLLCIVKAVSNAISKTYFINKLVDRNAFHHEIHISLCMFVTGSAVVGVSILIGT